MTFINSQVEIESLPKIEEVSLLPIHRSYLKVLRFEWLITALILIATAGILYFTIPAIRHSYGWMIIFGAVIFIISLHRFITEKSFEYLAYAVRDKDVLFQQGWIVRTKRVSPFNRTQNCSVQSGPLERKFGLASLIIYTAGSGNAEIKIPGLMQDEADKLRQFILSKIDTKEDAV